MKPSFLIVGLGNPGKEYAATRHNIGFAAIDKLASSCGSIAWEPKQKFLADCCDVVFNEVPLLLIKPTTYMNNSGNAVFKSLKFFELNPARHLVVVCDDVDLPAGEIRFALSGGAGSHNGLKSIVDQIGESFPRIRIGIRGSDAPVGSFRGAGQDLASYVLSKPTEEEQHRISAAMENISSLIRKHVLAQKETTEDS